MQYIYHDLWKNEIVLTDSVKDVILQKHPEVADFIDMLADILSHPDEVRRSTHDERSTLYYRFEPSVLGGKWVVAVVKRVERYYVSTLYATDKVKSGEVIWTKTT